MGIGTETPKERFQIGDRWTFHDGGHKLQGYNFYFGGQPAASRRIGVGAASLLRYTDTGDISFQVAPSGAADSEITWMNTLFVKNDGNIGIGTLNPTSKLDVAGSISAGAVAATTFSGNGAALTNVNATTMDGVSSAAYRTRGIVYLAGCDGCGLLQNADDQKGIYVNVVGPMTINSITCVSNEGTPSINIARDDGTPVNVLSVNLQCSTTGASTSTIVPAEQTLSLNDRLNFDVTPDGVAKRVTIAIKTTVN
jgi:hypothetical protein